MPGTGHREFGPKRDSDVRRRSPYLGPVRSRGVTRLNADASQGRKNKAIDLSSRGIGLLASHTEVAKAAEALLRWKFSFADADNAEALVALGGDGFMLHTLHEMLDGNRRQAPVFGMNRG